MAGEVMQKVRWACPKCDSGPDGCDKGSEEQREKCDARYGCMGLICECDGDTPPDHGDHLGAQCPDARCYHCGWAGSFPPTPKKTPGWAKKAMEAGWRPPAGWTP